MSDTIDALSSLADSVSSQSNSFQTQSLGFSTKYNPSAVEAQLEKEKLARNMAATTANQAENAERDRIIELVANVAVPVASFVIPGPQEVAAGVAINKVLGAMATASPAVIAALMKSPAIIKLLADSKTYYANLKNALGGKLQACFASGTKEGLENAAKEGGGFIQQISDKLKDFFKMAGKKGGSGAIDTFDKNYLKKLGINAEDFKESIVGTAGARYNVGINKSTGEIFLTPVKKGGESIPTGYNNLDDLKKLFPYE